MIFRIIWSKFSESQLDKIFEYYKKEASLRVAKKLLKDIINEPKKLIHSPEIGQEEELLLKREEMLTQIQKKEFHLLELLIKKGLKLLHQTLII